VKVVVTKVTLFASRLHIYFFPPSISPRSRTTSRYSGPALARPLVSYHHAYLSMLGAARRGVAESTSLVSSIRTSRMSPLCISALPSQLTDTGAHSASSLSSLSQSGCTCTSTRHRYHSTFRIAVMFVIIKVSNFHI
jgi:hypothetical protein